MMPHGPRRHNAGMTSIRISWISLLLMCRCAGAAPVPRRQANRVAAIAVDLTTSTAKPNTEQQRRNVPPQLIAHRGDSIAYPENTLESFISAHEKGADVIETDVFLTADGVIVCIHDTTVTRTTEATGQVSSYTLAELQRLDAGYRWTNDSGVTFPFRGTGVYVPTLREALERL